MQSAIEKHESILTIDPTNREACLGLGKIYNGSGVEADAEQRSERSRAFEILEKVASMGLPEAYMQLGLCCSSEGGMSSQYRAVKLFALAGKQGVPLASDQLEQCFTNGVIQSMLDDKDALQGKSAIDALGVLSMPSECCKMLRDPEGSVRSAAVAVMQSISEDVAEQG